MVYDPGLNHPSRAQQYLATQLYNGTLVLFLGAGVSKELGLPGWVEFINRIRDSCQLPRVDGTANAAALQMAADEVKKKCRLLSKYHDILRSALYEDISTLSVDILKNSLFIALGSLMMGSKRGHVSRVITLNYDSMLEWLLQVHGYVFRVVHRFPELEGSEDVRLYHTHGFLPHRSMDLQDSQEVILGFDSVCVRLGKTGDPLHELTRHILRSGVCLFVGLSEKTLTDYSLAPLLVTVGKEIENERVTGIWLSKEEITLADQFNAHNIIPLHLPSEEKIANFLLGISQEAASSINFS